MVNSNNRIIPVIHLRINDSSAITFYPYVITTDYIIKMNPKLVIIIRICHVLHFAVHFTAN